MTVMSLLSRIARYVGLARAHIDTTTGPRAVLGSQQPPTRSDTQAIPMPVPRSDVLRAEDGSRSVPFGPSAALAVVSRCALLALAFLATPPHLDAAEWHPSGRDIFRQDCAKCHGRNGDGVKGKYDGHLQGERSLEKLTRYIERNMPDDNPGKLSAEDAATVARFIYDTFYSRDVRLRSSRPPRVELVRLTNLQYLNSVADLLKELTGHSGAGVPPATRASRPDTGLRATYYNSKDFNGDKKTIE